MKCGLAIVMTLAILSSIAMAESPPTTSQVASDGSGGNPTIPCSSLPPGAVITVPQPFDRYMRFECHKYTGQGLVPVDGFHWMNPQGMGIGLSSSKAEPDAAGQMHFPFSWYTRLDAVNLSASEQQQLRADFQRGIQPDYLKSVSILELDAVTSNAEEKRIYLIVPLDGPSPPWIIGLECNGACFHEDTEPMMFFGEPNTE